MNRKFSLVLIAALGLTPCLAAYVHAQADKQADENEALWIHLDRNESGWLSGNELNGGWVKYDTDADGEVTKAEFMAGRVSEGPASQPKSQQAIGATSEADRVKDAALFVKLDTSGEGYLDGGELKEDAFQRYDADADGRVVLAEFAAGRAKDRLAGAITGSTKRTPVRQKPAAAAQRTPSKKAATGRTSQGTSPKAPAAKPSSGSKFKKGDEIEAWDTGWYKARVLEVGTGEHQGSYMVHFEGYSSASDHWVQAKNIRVRPGAEPAVPPRAGKYYLQGYGNIYNPIYLGYFILSGGNQYRFYNMGNKLIGTGRYRFSGASKKVSWLSGPFKKSNWGGKFEVSRQGKTHSITVNRATVASNSTDSRR